MRDSRLEDEDRCGDADAEEEVFRELDDGPERVLLEKPPAIVLFKFLVREDEGAESSGGNGVEYVADDLKASVLVFKRGGS